MLKPITSPFSRPVASSLSPPHHLVALSEKLFNHALDVINLLNATNYIPQGIKAWRMAMEEEEKPENPIGCSRDSAAGRKAYEASTLRRGLSAVHHLRILHARW